MSLTKFNKTVLFLLLSFITMFALFIGCGDDDKDEDDVLTVNVTYSGVTAGSTMYLAGWTSIDALEASIEDDADPEYDDEAELSSTSGTNTFKAEVPSSPVYLAVFIDENENEWPDEEEYFEIYNGVSMDNYQNATPIAVDGATTVNITLGPDGSGSGDDNELTIVVNYIDAAEGDTLSVFGWESMSSMIDSISNDEEPDYMDDYEIEAGDLTEGAGSKTFVAEGVPGSVYVCAFLDKNGDGEMDAGEYLEFYEDVAFANYALADAVTVDGTETITINLNTQISK